MSDRMPSGPRRTFAGVIGGLVGLVALSAVAGLLVTLAVTPAVAATSAAATGAIDTFDNLPSDLRIDQLQLPTTIYTKDPATGAYVPMTRFYDQNRLPVTWDQVAPVMYDAILSSEDPRFYDEGGIDLIGTARALISNLKGDSTIQGGSSISQQYVKNVLVQDCYGTVDDENLPQAKKDAALQTCYVNATNDSGPGGYLRKLQEMRYAIAIDQKYSKNQILLAYLNIADFGGVTYGIEAASEYYFGVHASQLDLSQAATLAGMVQNPNTYRLDEPGNKANGTANHYALTKQRQEYVLGRMQTLGKITEAQYDAAMKGPITPTITPPKTGCANTGAPYFCAYVTAMIRSDPAFGATPPDRERALRQGGLNVYTTLDWRLQNAAQATVSKYAPASMPGFGYGSTIVNIQPSTGDIMSIAQNTAYSATATDTGSGSTGIVYAGDSVEGSSGFPAGSSFKLFTILDWLETGHSLNQVLDGRLRVFHHITNSCQGDWTNTTNTLVKNFQNNPGFVGTPMQFTAESLNTGFFAMATQLDLCQVVADASKLGVTLAATGKPVLMNNLFSVIGINAVSPIAMAGAYAAIANNGKFCQPQAIVRVTDSTGHDLPIPKRTCTQVVAPNIAATTSYDLQGVMHGAGTGALGNPHDGTAVFGKTGTNNQDQTWLIESSTAMTSLVWSGTTNHEGNPNLDMFDMHYHGNLLGDIRYPMAAEIQRAADQYYPGGVLPEPDPSLLFASGSVDSGTTPGATPTPGNGNTNTNGNGNGNGNGGQGQQPPVTTPVVPPVTIPTIPPVVIPTPPPRHHKP